MGALWGCQAQLKPVPAAHQQLVEDQAIRVDRQDLAITVEPVDFPDCLGENPLAVQVSVVNRSAAPVHLTSRDVYLVDSQGIRHVAMEPERLLRLLPRAEGETPRPVQGGMSLAAGDATWRQGTMLWASPEPFDHDMSENRIPAGTIFASSDRLGYGYSGLFYGPPYHSPGRYDNCLVALTDFAARLWDQRTVQPSAAERGYFAFDYRPAKGEKVQVAVEPGRQAYALQAEPGAPPPTGYQAEAVYTFDFVYE